MPLLPPTLLRQGDCAEDPCGRGEGVCGVERIHDRERNGKEPLSWEKRERIGEGLGFSA